MNRKLQHVFVLGLVAAALIFSAMYASATPPAGIAGGPILARGVAAETLVLGTPAVAIVSKTVKVRVNGKVFTRQVKVKVDTVRRLMSCSGLAACDTAFQQVTINPGGHTGWHTHPGPTFVSVAQGEGTLYHASGTTCMGHKFASGAGFFQPSTEVHNLRNEGAAPLVLYALYVLPSGTPNSAIRIDQPAPVSCSSIP